MTSKYDEISAFGKFMKDCVNVSYFCLCACATTRRTIIALQSTPDERPSAAVLLKDPFFDE